MRQFINAVALLEAITVPQDPYGYWIMPDGSVIPASDKAHVEAACQQLGIDYDSIDWDEDVEGEQNFNLRFEAIEQGAIRVLWEHGGILNVEMRNPTVAGMRSLIAVVQANAHAQGYLVEYDYTVQRFLEARQILAYLRREMRDL
jgi:hypothetical protein